MTPQEILDLTRSGLLIVLWATLPVVLAAMVSALVISMLQAVTQIQDQSIGQSVRMIVVLLVIVVMAGWLGRDVLRFAERAFQNVQGIG